MNLKLLTGLARVMLRVDEWYNEYMFSKSNFTFATGDTGIHEWILKGDLRYIVSTNSTSHIAGI